LLFTGCCLLMAELSPRYNPAEVEERLYQQWESAGLFHADNSSKKKPYTIVIPPPNVTGMLHMGHALNNTIQDICIRFKKMQGFNTLWIPGTDHAGIATQNVVEKQIAKEGLKRQDLGREKFLERVWQWREQYGNTIIRQLKRLGSSCDWKRTRFTMDEGLSEAVLDVFIQLYEKGLIYRGSYIINWCPRCQTALADEEAPHKDMRGKLYYVKYQIKGQVARGGGQEYVVVATTRPETMLGDTAVAVNPKDKRYKHLIGQKLILPLVARELPVIADDLVDIEFGTGAVKVTPAHDPVDFQLSKRHALEVINIMTDDAHMKDVPEVYFGLDRFECRKKVLTDLEAQGLLEKITDHQNAVGHCYRCDTVVEPRLSPQWFVKMKPLAVPAIKAVKEKKITFTPTRWTKVYLNWMENIQDWCISRQIWWGHRLPVYYCKKCVSAENAECKVRSAESKTKKRSTPNSELRTPNSQGVIVSKTRPEKCPYCGCSDLKQDEDVLDTWFSSWLWPFSTLGWPSKTQDLKAFYPTDTLVTAPEIIFFWVARMIMAGEFCMKDIPFSRVYIHGTVRDLTGRKMSKSLGNVIDPLEIIQQFGADALRYTLVTSTAIGQDIFLSDDKFIIGRNFANKLWNVTRYVLASTDGKVDYTLQIPRSELAVADEWILSRLNQTIVQVTKALDKFSFNEAAHALYDFLWRDYCDWYVELSKITPDSRKTTTSLILVHVLEKSLRLLHPLMPFLTEELWQYLRSSQQPAASNQQSIMLAEWPKADKKLINHEAEVEFALFQAVVGAIRNIKAELNLPNESRPPIIISSASKEKESFFSDNKAFVQALSQSGEVRVERLIQRPGDAAVAVIEGMEIIIPLSGLIDVVKERARIQVRLNELKEEVSRLDSKLKDKQFTQKAPKEIVEQTKARRKQVNDTFEKFSTHMKLLEGM
jgi:valyl-tRNA synthetase